MKILLSALIMFFALSSLSLATVESCDPTGDADDPGTMAYFRNQYTGEGTGETEVGYTENWEEFVIDGKFDPNWQFAYTFEEYGWYHLAKAKDYCETGLRDYFGKRDIETIWRFAYSKTALYISAEIHDDIVDVDGLSPWFQQDGVEISIDPIEWAGITNWSDPTTTLGALRHMDNSQNPIPYTTASGRQPYNSFFHIIKRLKNEPYMVGWIGSETKNNQGPGEEKTNWISPTNSGGIETGTAYLGIDSIGREVWGMEFKIPFEGNGVWGGLYKALGKMNSAGVIEAGTRFKMDLVSTDDDKPGPDGTQGNSTSHLARRYDFFYDMSGKSHWSDTWYFPVFTFVNGHNSSGKIPFGSKGINLYGDSTIAGPWQDLNINSNLYTLTAGGVLKDKDNATFKFKPALESDPLGSGIIYDLANNVVGSYSIVTDATNPYKDVLTLTFGSNIVNLERSIILGYLELSGRWVSTIDSSKEYRFSTLSNNNKYLNDSCRIYLKGSEGLFTELSQQFTYTATELLFGRDLIASIEPKEKIKSDDPTMFFIKYSSDGINVDSLDTIIKFNPITFSKIHRSFDTSKAGLMDKLDLRGWKSKLFVKYGFQPFYNDTAYSKTVSNNNGVSLSIQIKTDTTQTITANNEADTFHVEFYADNSILWTDTARQYDNDIISLNGDTIFAVTYLNYEDTTVEPPKSAIDTIIDTVVEISRNKGYFSVIGTYKWIHDTLSMDYELADISLDGDSIWNVDMDLTDTLILDMSFAEKFDTTKLDTFVVSRYSTSVFTTATEELVSNNSIVTLSNSPNPFNPSTKINFSIPEKYRYYQYSLTVYDVKGRALRTLVSEKVGNLGTQKSIVWNGKDKNNTSVSSGIYFYRLQVKDKVITNKMLMIK